MARWRLLLDPRLPFAVLGGLVAALLLLVLAVRLLGIEGPLLYTDLPRVDGSDRSTRGRSV